LTKSRISLPQKEIDRLVKFAEGLGIIVSFHSQGSDGDAASWSESPPHIEVYLNANPNKTDVILCLLHELGHHFDWIRYGKKETPEAYLEDNNRKEGDPPLSLDKRRIIYENEKRGINYMLKIAKQLDLKYPKLWRVKAEMTYDKWVYRHYFYNGEYPSNKLRKEKKEKLIELYRKKASNEKS